MNPTAIYSKSGKGVQEAAGKTSLLARTDRAVLSAIDGRATLADVAQRVGKPFDPAFQGLITKLDKDGFIREVTPGVASTAPAAAAKPAARPAASPAPKAAAPVDPESDLDFSMLGAAKPKSTPVTPTAPPKEQESALFKARQEAEAKAQAERERLRLEAESKMRAETEAKLRAEAQAKLRAELEAKTAAEAEAKIKAAREAAVKAAAEAKAKAEAEATRARAEAERIRREAEEREREAEELRQRLEAERKAREETERKAREEAEQARRALEEERRKLEEERKRRDEEERREAEERAARRKAQEEEEAREAAEREARRKAREEEDAREAEEREARRRRAREEEERVPRKEDPPAAVPAGGFADSLMADLESFTNQEEEEAKAKAEAEIKAREEAERRAREAEEQRAREEAKRRSKEEAAQKKLEEEERLRREEEEEKERIRAEEERRRQEAQERERKAKEEEALARKAQSTAPPPDYQSEDKRRKRALAAHRRSGEDSRIRRRSSFAKPIAITLLLVLVAVLGAAHVMPIATVDYERAASEALGRPVRLGQARLWLLSGLPEVRFGAANLGEVKIGRIIARPHLSSLTDQKKSFESIELENVSLPQEALGELLFARLKGDLFTVSRVLARGIEMPGPVALPKDLQADITFGENGAVTAATLRGADGLLARLEPKGSSIEFQVDAGSFIVPIAPEVSLTQFAMKGTADARGMQIKQWDGAALNGTLSGTARVRWGGTWSVEGVITARGINAAVFAPALLSEGRGEGTGKFSLSGPEPAKLGTGGRIEGNFTVSKGVLGSFDLSRAIQTSGKSAQGRTQFAEMNGQAVYDRGAVALRNVTIGAGALNAGASADIAQSGALSGRIVADVRTASQTLSATLNLGGTVKEPQVRN